MSDKLSQTLNYITTIIYMYTVHTEWILGQKKK